MVVKNGSLRYSMAGMIGGILLPLDLRSGSCKVAFGNCKFPFRVSSYTAVLIWKECVTLLNRLKNDIIVHRQTTFLGD